MVTRTGCAGFSVACAIARVRFVSEPLVPHRPHAIPAGGCYNFTGHSQPDVQYKANAVKTSAKGYRSIWFRNGNTTIDIAYPAYYMRGATAGPLGLCARSVQPPAEGAALCVVYGLVSTRQPWQPRRLSMSVPRREDQAVQCR